MHAQDQTQQPDQPPTPLAPPAPAAQGPVEEQQQQLLVVECSICLEDVQPNEPREQCRTCRKIYCRSCINKWLVVRRNQKQETNCPNCRASWALNNLPALPICPICQQYIELTATRIACRDCGSVFHQDELLTYVIQLNNVQQPLICWDCPADMSWVLGLQAASAFSEDFIIQSAEQNNDINNFNLDSLFESESESESDED